MKDKYIRAKGTTRAVFVGNNLKINEKETKHKERGSLHCYHGENTISVIYWNNNVPVILISNFHPNLPHTSVKYWN